MSAEFRLSLEEHGEELQLFSAAHRNRLEVISPAGELSMTRQEFANECDINTIMASYDKTSVMDRFWQREPLYVDFTAMPNDLQGAMDALEQAREAFMRLPASTRKEFDHDPVKFVEFAQEKDNLERMREWGLAPRPEAPAAPIRVEVVPPPAAPPIVPAAS